MKTKLIFVLLFFISLFACTASAQDYRINIGKAYFRFDSDSNRIRIGGNPIPKIARELDAQLFDFNTNQFLWDRTKGLCLANLQSYDTCKTRKLIIFKDTGNGELIPYRSRIYTIYKPNYANNPDCFDLRVQYVSLNDVNGKSNMIELNLLNNIYELSSIPGQTDITGTGYAPLISPFPRSGLYLITISYEYEYNNAVDNSPDDIQVQINYNSTTVRDYHHSWKHSSTEVNNLRLPACITFPLAVSDLSKKIEIQIYGNNSPSCELYIYNFYISAVLIN